MHKGAQTVTRSGSRPLALDDQSAEVAAAVAASDLSESTLEPAQASKSRRPSAAGAAASAAADMVAPRRAAPHELADAPGAHACAVLGVWLTSGTPPTP